MWIKEEQRGFTLIELMIVIAIIGILSSVAIPQYFIYTQKAKFSDLVQQTHSWKTAVQLCIQDTNTTANCSSNLNGVPADITTARGNLQSMTTVGGVITATAIPALSSYDYVLTANHDAANNTTTWSVSGTCFAAQVCRR